MGFATFLGRDQTMTGTETFIGVMLAVAVVLLLAWDVLQSRRLDRLQKRVEALENK